MSNSILSEQYLRIIRERYGETKTLQELNKKFAKDAKMVSESLKCSFDEAFCFVLDMISPDLYNQKQIFLE